jgi:predicted DNA-binding transcriptional regulator YafY
VARYVTESSWHSSQQLTPQNDGSLLAEFDLGHTEEIKRWIQSFGKHAVVLEPEQLRTEIVDEIDALRGAYASDTTESGPSESSRVRRRTAFTEKQRPGGLP